MDRSDVERRYESSLALIDRLSRHACRGSRMNDADVDDFCAWVRLKLFEDDYAILRRFEQRCSLPTFLAVVIRRLLLDYRGRVWGRFRTSAEAERLGPIAVALEELLHRDGKSLDDAVEELRRRNLPVNRAEAESLARRLPPRMKRTHVEIGDVPESHLVASQSADERLLHGERMDLVQQLASALRGAIADLPSADQTLLRLHFAAGVSVADISRSMAVDQQLLYRRIRALCRELRERLIAAGIDRSRIAELIGERELDLGLAEKILPSRSSIRYSKGSGGSGGRDDQ